MTVSRLELFAVLFAGAGTFVATLQAWISYAARSDFIEATIYAETATSCASLLSATSSFADSIAGVLMLSYTTQTPVNLLPLSQEIESFRSAKDEMENSLYRLSVIAPTNVVSSANYLSKTMDQLHKSAQLDRVAQLDEAMAPIQEVLIPNQVFSRACRDFIQNGREL